MTNTFRTPLLMLGGLLACIMLAAAPASAADNPFATPQKVDRLAASDAKCGAGKCATGKCGAAPASPAAAPAMSRADQQSLCAQKIRSGFCGAGKCAAGKCGASLKEKCARMMEGKCGAK
jgi:uncharacterized low-complexity protein